MINVLLTSFQMYICIPSMKHNNLMQRMLIQTPRNLFFAQNRIFSETHYIQIMMTLILKLCSNYDTFSFLLCLDQDAISITKLINILSLFHLSMKHNGSLKQPYT